MRLQQISSDGSTGQDEWCGIGVRSTSELSWLARAGGSGRDNRRDSSWAGNG